MSDALKSNTTLTKLDLSCEGNNIQIVSVNNPLFSTYKTVNDVQDIGATSLSDALKSSTTLTKLNLGGEHKRNNTQMASIDNPLFSILIKSAGNYVTKS